MDNNVLIFIYNIIIIFIPVSLQSTTFFYDIKTGE